MRKNKKKDLSFGNLEQLEKRFAMTADVVNALHSEYYEDQNISFDEMQSLIESTKDHGRMYSPEFNALHKIVNQSQMPDHVRYLAQAAIKGSQANRYFQGKFPLGNLRPGSSASQVQTMVDKWFGGKDLPKHGKWYATYKEVEGNLFVNGISHHDVRQGRVGNCWQIAGLRGVAESNPQVINNMFLEVGEDLWVVRWYHPRYKDAHYVTVNNELPVVKRGWRINESVFATFGHDRNHNDNPNNELWGALAEKSYAQVSQTTGFRRTNDNSYQNLRAGNMSELYVSISKVNCRSIRILHRRVDNGWLIRQVNRWDNAVSLVMKGHAYTITHYNHSTGKFRLDNPYGRRHLDLTLNEIKARTGGYLRIFRKGIVTASMSNHPLQTGIT